MWLVVRGVIEIVQALGADEAGGRWALVLGGVLDGVIGVLFMSNPGSAVLGVTFLLGMLAFLWGLAIVGLAFVARRAASRGGGSLADPVYG